MSKDRIGSSAFHDYSEADAAVTEYELIVQTSEFLKENGIIAPEVVIILGSGLGGYIDNLKDMIRIPYGDIPGFVQSTAPTHEGALYYGEHQGKKIAIMNGRFHYYEGWPMKAIVFPIRVMAVLGAKRLIITNAAGGINYDYKAGDIMLVKDHINMSGNNPLIGPNVDELGVRFPDMTYGYNAEIRGAILKEAVARDIPLHEGVYVMMSGPSFETPAEIRFLRTIGADAVGMSTVPEAIAANHAGMDVVGLSCISNAAAGITGNTLSSEEVSDAAELYKHTIEAIINIAIEV